MSKSYQTSFDSTRSPMSTKSPSSALSPDAFKTNIHRNKTKRWVEAPTVDYGGGWGDDDDEYDDYDDPAPPSNVPLGRSNTGTTASGATATRPLQRQNSFDRGDDDVIISPIGRAATWQLPPTPLELEQRERMGSVPQIRLQQSQPPPPPTAYPPQIHGEAPQTRGQGVPIIQVPTTGQPAAGTLIGKAATSTTIDQRSQIQSDLRRDETPSPIQARVSVPATPANESTPQLYGSREHVPAPVPPTNESTSQSYGSRERVPPPFGVGPTTQPPAAPISAEDKHLPQVLNEVRSQEGEGSPGPTTPALSQPQEVEGTAPPPHEQMPDVHKPTPPLPLLEDTCLETISEHDSVVSGPSSPTNVMAPTRNISSYDDYASNYSGEGYEISQSSPHYKESTVPLYIPSLPSAKQQPVSSSPPPPASTAAKSRITRPADIYKRHQENLKQQHTGDSSRTSSDSTARPSIDVQNSPLSIDAARPPTRELMHNQSQVSDPTTLPQQHSRASSEDLREPSRDSSRPSSRQERGQIASQISQDDPSRPDSRSGGITITTEQSSHLPERHPPAAPASPFVPEDPPNAKTSETPSWGEDIISGYTTSAMDTTTSNKSDYFTPPTGQSRFASSTSVPQISASPQQETAVGRGFQTMVDTAFIRQDTLLPTPLSDSSTPREALSPILPPPPVPPKEEGGKWRASYQRNTLTPTQDDPSRELQQLSPTPDNKRAPSPDAWREGARRSSTPVVLPPVLTESVSGIMDEATPIDTREKDDLDTLIVQLERAQTPVPPSPDIPKQTSEAHLQTGCDHLDAFQNSSNPRESMGVFSIYGEYWEDGDEAPASLAPASPTPPPIQPKSPLRGVRSIEGPISTQQIPSAQPGAPKGRSPSPPPAVSIPVAPKNAEEPATPASSVDEELIEMASAGNRFLDRRGTGFSVSSSKDRAESRPQLSSVTESENKTPLQPPVIKPDSKGIQVIPPVKQLGPESEGIEAITGPTVEKRPKSKEDENTPVESEYAKELVSQFSRPQTLMLKDTMPMPTGMLVMPSMPPLPGKEAGEVAPEVVNFDKDDVEGLEATEPDGPGLEAAHHHEDGLQVSLLAPPLGDNQPRLEPAGTNNRTVNQRAVLQDTKTIAALITPVERTKAYDALRWQVAESPDPLSEWIAHQMEHNNGEQLLKAEVVTIKSELSVKKSRSKIGLGHFPSRSGDHHHYEDGSALRAEEKLSQMGRGARKLGEKAGEKVGGWMKRVGKKGHSSKESVDEMDSGIYKSIDEPEGAPVESTMSLTGSYATSEHMSAASSSTATMRERVDTTGAPNIQSTASLPSQQSMPQKLPQSQPYSSASAPQLPNIQTQFQPKFQPSQPTPSPIQRMSGEETRQHTPTQYYRTAPVDQAIETGPRSASSPRSALIVTSPPPSSQPTFPARTDSLLSKAATPSGTSNTALPAPAPAAFPRRGDSLQHARETSLSGPPPSQPPEKLLPPKEDSDDEDLYSEPTKAKPMPPKGQNPTPQQGQYKGQILQQMGSPQQIGPPQQMGPPQHVPNIGTQHPLKPQLNQHGPYRPEQTQQILPPGLIQGYAPSPGQMYPPPPSQASHGPLLAGYTAQFPGPRHHQQPQFQPQQPPPSRGSSLVKTLSGLSSPHKRSMDQPPGSSSSSEKKEKVKRSSFLGNLGNKLDGVGRSGSVSSSQWTGDSNAPPPKMVKHGSLLTKLGQRQKKTEDGKAQKGHKKGFSDIFTRSGSNAETPGSQTNKKPGKLAMAGLIGGRSGGAAALVRDQPKIYNAQTGQYVTYEQTIQRSASAPYGPPQQVRAPPQHSEQQPMAQQPAGFRNPLHPMVAQQTGGFQLVYGPPPSQSGHTYPPGVPSQQFSQQHQPMHHSQTTSVHSRHSPHMARHHSVAAAYPAPPQQQHIHSGPEQHNPPHPPQPQQSVYGPNSGSPEMLTRQPTHPLHERQGQRQGVPPPPNFLHQQDQGAPPPQPHLRDYQHQQYPGYQQYGAPPPVLEPTQHPQSASPQHQLQYTQPAPLPDHTGYQSPSSQSQSQRPSQPPQLPPLPRFDTALSRQPTQSSVGDSVYGTISHRGSVAESGGRSESIPSPPQQYRVTSQGISVADMGVGTGSASPPPPHQHHHAQHSQQPQSSPQLSRADTVASNVSSVSAQAPPPLPASTKDAAQSPTQAPGYHPNPSPAPPTRGSENLAVEGWYNVPQPPRSGTPHEPYTKSVATSTSNLRTLSMGSENRFASPFGSGEHEGGVSLNPGSTDTVPSPPPPSVSNGLNTPSSNTLSTVTKANPQSHGEEVKMTFFNDQSESSKDVSVSVTPPPKSKEEVKDMEVEEKIAVRHEGDGEKEVFYEEKKGNEKDEDDKDEVGYSMSSTVYPGLWEPEYFTG